MQPLHGPPGGHVDKVPFVVPENDEGGDAINHLFLEGLGLGFLALMMVGQKMSADLSAMQTNGSRAIRPEAMFEPLRMFKPGS